MRSHSKSKDEKQSPHLKFNNKQQDYIVEYVLSIDGKMTSRKYAKKGLLGSGGFANCYIVENLETKKKAAAKIISKEVLTTYRTKLRVMNEIKLHKTFHHPNVVEFYHFFEDKNNIYIFLQLCEHQSLNQLIKIRQSFTTPQIQTFIYGLIQGLIYLHSKHIIHRDLKLGNIFVNQNLNVKIGDFGLATKLEFLTQFKRTICGTPNYIAPQILQGKGYHFQVDIWSIGVIMYTLYVGYPPFETQQATQTYRKIKNIDYCIPVKNQSIPQQAINLIVSILVKNPVHRPTLQQILDSDFMRMGKGILTSLPKVCTIKAPSKKQLLQNTSINIPIKALIKKTHARQNSQNDRKISNIIQNKQPQFVIKVEHVFQNSSYIYELNDNSKGVLTKDNYILYRNSENKIIKFDTRQPFESQINYQPTNETYILNTFNQTTIKNTKQDLNKPLKFLYVEKITHYKNFYMIRLSNLTLEILFDTKDGFYICQPEKIFYFDSKLKVSLLSSKDVMMEKCQQLKWIEHHKLGYLRGILTEIKSRKPKRQFRESV